jgi:hypothetical protein
MTYWLAETFKAVGDRLLSDTGTGGLFNAGTPLVPSLTVYNQWAGFAYSPDTSADFPRIVFEFNRYDPASQAFDLANYDLDFSIHTFVRMTDVISDPMQRWVDIMTRIHGDWFLQASRQPTYGLDRWKPTLGSGGTASGFEAPHITFESAENIGEVADGLYQSVQRFKIQPFHAGA